MAQKLSDTQLIILSTACQRQDRSVFPVTAKIAGGALQKVLKSLLGKGLLEEVESVGRSDAWRTTGEGARLTLRATPSACDALGIEQGEVSPEATATTSNGAPAEEDSPATADAGHTGAQAGDGAAPARKAKGRATSRRTPSVRPTKANAPEGRAGTKQAQLIAMLRRPEGASIDEIIAATGWQAHTVRGAIAGALKKKLGLTVTSEKGAGRGRVYRIA